MCPAVLQLEARNRELIEALDPPHRYVPWVTIDGAPLYEVSNMTELLSGIETSCRLLLILHSRVQMVDIKSFLGPLFLTNFEDQLSDLRFHDTGSGQLLRKNL